MIVGELCNRIVVFARPEETVREAARRMRDNHVGDLVVVEKWEVGRVPVGIVTDRDLVVGPLAGGEDLDRLRVGEVMSRDIVTACERDDLEHALQTMRVNGIRRLPVVDDEGVLQGILTLDDVLEHLDEELAALVQLVAREQAREARQLT